MARPVYSTRFLGEHDVDGDAPYIVPAGFVAVLKCVDAYYNAVPPAPGQLLLLGDNGQVIVALTWVLSPVSQHQQWTGTQVLDTGFLVTTDATMDVSVSGYLLSLP